MGIHRPSRLEIYVDVLRSLEKLQRCNLFTLEEEHPFGNTFLRNALGFLERQGLIRQEKVGEEILYSVTTQGELITRYFMVQNEKMSYTPVK